MYLPDLLNEYGFFLRVATLGEEQEYAELLPSLLSRATSSVLSINRIDQLQRQCLAEFDLFADQLENLDELVVFNSASMVALQNEISPLLSSLRIMQDLANDIIRKLSKIQVPRSISDTMKKIKNYGLPIEIVELCEEYWLQRGGKQLRDYRILDQHYSNIVDHVFLRLSPERNVLLVFPDNPEEQSRRKFKYDQKICGISILRVGFDEIQEFVDRVLMFYKIDPSPHSHSLYLSQWGDLRPYRKRTLGVLYQNKIVGNEDNKKEMNISALRFGQLADGRIEVQNLVLSEEKVSEINKKNNT